MEVRRASDLEILGYAPAREGRVGKFMLTSDGIPFHGRRVEDIPVDLAYDVLMLEIAMVCEGSLRWLVYRAPDDLSMDVLRRILGWVDV